MARASTARRHFGAALLFLFLVIFQDAALASSPDLIEAGASQNHFYIEPSYDGTSIAFFGSVDSDRLKNEPFDVAITIRGPIRPVRVWKKSSPRRPLGQRRESHLRRRSELLRRPFDEAARGHRVTRRTQD